LPLIRACCIYINKVSRGIRLDQKFTSTRTT